MVPIIFAVSIVTFPSLIGQILQRKHHEVVERIGDWLVSNLSMNNP